MTSDALRARSSGLLANKNFVRGLSLAIVMSAWEIYGRAAGLFTSYPTEIIEAAWTSMVPTVLPAFWTTIKGFSTGFAISAPLGIVIGMALGRVRLLDVALTPFMMALYSTPRITLIPLLVLWVGIDFKLRVVIVVLSSIFPIIINVHAGVREIEGDFLDVGRVFIANRRQSLLTIVVPGSLPYVFAGLRIGLARALGAVVVAELTAAVAGIGRLILESARFLRIDEMFVPLLLLGVLSIMLTAILVKVQKLAMPWNQSQRGV